MASILGAWSQNRKRIARYSFFACIAMQAYATDPASASETDERTLGVLQREADGQMLNRATELSTTGSDRSNLAHWVSGEVLVAGKWIPVNELENIQTSDQTKEYVRRRGTERLNEAEHRKLAKWCETKSLEEQRMSHWHGVLAFNEEDMEGSFSTTETNALISQINRVDGTRLVDTDSGGGKNDLHVANVNDIHVYPYFSQTNHEEC